MATRRELEQQINFALDQLGTRNQQHEFEHICRKLARQRICGNILPATGPVSAGGDQGRDFETFRSHLTDALDSPWFLGVVSEGPIAFACTLQRKGLERKLRNDVATICAGAERPNEIHCFCVVPLTVSKRHDLQAWARENFEVHLEIYDRVALAEQLTDPDLFWIAAEYLDISSSHYPSPEAEDAEYAAMKARWQTAEARVFNYASFVELVSICESLRREVARQPDVGFWLEALEGFFRPTPSPYHLLKERARYEYLVIKLRIQGELLGEEQTVLEAFEDASKTDSWTVLEEAANLSNYARGAVARGALGLGVDQVLELRAKVAARVEQLIATASNPSEKCWLLHIRGYLALRVDLDWDASESFGWWSELLALAPEAPLFPISRLSKLLTQFAEFLVDHDGFDAVLEASDALVGKQEGEFARAEKCMERGVALSKAGRLVHAVHELNRGKVFAFSQERLEQVVAATLIVARLYEQLHCTYAAKYYALAAAHLALKFSTEKPRLTRFVRPAIVQCAQADYLNGSFAQALDFLELGVRAEHTHEGQEPDDDDWKRVRLYGGWVLAASSLLPAAQHELVRQRIALWPGGEELLQLEREVAEAFAANPDGVQDGKPVFRRRLFSDLEPRQQVKWTALGVSWRVHWRTTPSNTLAGEALLAALQIVTVDLARWDLYLLPSECDVEIRSTIAGEPTLTHEPDNKRARWIISVPEEFDAIHARLVAFALTMLSGLSLQPKLFQHIEEAHKAGLAENTFVVDSYDRLLGGLVNVAAWLEGTIQAIDVVVDDSVSPELDWNRTLIPEYREADTEELLRRRYEVGERMTRVTRKRWVQTASGARIVSELRDSGWLDWQILGALATLTANWRTTEGKRAVPTRTEFMKQADVLETEDMPTPPVEAWTMADLEMALRFNALSTAAGLGLVGRQRTPTFDAVLSFLRAKTGFFTDDIPHDDPFAVE